jgi:hypothetical protein
MRFKRIFKFSLWTILILAVGIFLFLNTWRMRHIASNITDGRYVDAATDAKFIALEPLAFISYRLGNMFWFGRLGMPNPERAVPFYRFAAYADYAPGQVALGQAYWIGKGVPRHVTYAELYFFIAQAQNYHPAVYHFFKTQAWELWLPETEAIARLIKYGESKELAGTGTKSSAEKYLSESRVTFYAISKYVESWNDPYVQAERSLAFQDFEFKLTEKEIKAAAHLSNRFEYRWTKLTNNIANSCSVVDQQKHPAHEITEDDLLCLLHASTVRRSIVNQFRTCMEMAYRNDIPTSIFADKARRCEK